MACGYTHGVVPGTLGNESCPVPPAPRGFPGPSTSAPQPSQTTAGHHYEREVSPPVGTSCSCCPPPPPQWPCCPPHGGSAHPSPSPHWHHSSPSTSSHPPSPSVHTHHVHEPSLHQNSPVASSHPHHSHTSHPHTYHPSPHYPHSPSSHVSTTHLRYPSPHPQTPSSHIHHSHPPSSPPSHYSHHHQHHHPPYTASPLTHSWRNPHSSSAFQHHGHGTDSTHHPSTYSNCHGVPTAQNPRSVCQVNPTRRQIIPTSAANSSNIQDTGEEEPISPTFVAETPSPNSALSETADRPSALPSLSNSMQRASESHFGVNMPTNNMAVPTATCSTPPHNSHAAPHSECLQFSPYDGPSAFSRINFQLAAPSLSMADLMVPVNHVQIPEPILSSPHHTSRGNSVHETSTTTRFSSSLPRRSNQLLIAGSSSSSLNQVNEDELEIPMADSGGVSPMQGGSSREDSSAHLTSWSLNPLAKPPTSFSGDEKIGHEMVVLEHCNASGSSWRMNSSHTAPSILSHSFPLVGGRQQHMQCDDSDSDVIVNNRGWGRGRRRQGETFFYVKEEEVKEEEDESEQIQVLERQRFARMTRSQAAKLVSDSDHSESDPYTSTRRTRKKHRGKRRGSPPGHSHRSGEHDGEIKSSGEGGTGSEEGEVTVIAESDDDDGDENREGDETLVMYSSPVATRTRSRVTTTDSSQSEGEMPPPPSSSRTKCRNSSRSPKTRNRGVEKRLGERERGKKRETRRRGSGGPVVIETSQSESESVAMATDSAPTQSMGGGVTRKKMGKGRGEQEQETVCEEISVATDNTGTSISQDQPQSVGSEDKETMSSSVTMMSLCDPPALAQMSGVPLEANVGEGLSDWYIRIVGKNLIVVEGIKNHNKNRTWHSGPIVKRLSSRLVATRSGTLYHLEGPLNREGLVKLDIGELAAPFEGGFPENWLSVINRYLLQKILLKKRSSIVEKEEEEEEEKKMEEEKKVDDGGTSKVPGEEEMLDEEAAKEEEKEKEKEQEEGEDSDFPVVVRKKSTRRTRRQLLDYDSSASEKSEEGEKKRGRGKKTKRKESNLIVSSTRDTINPSLTDTINPSLTDEVNPSVTEELNPSLADNINPSLTEETQSTTDDELVRGTRQLRVKEEEAGEGACPLTTPEGTPNTSASSFISSLKRSSRGRTLKPVSSSFCDSSTSSIQYSYDMRGNFIGLTGPVVDLTLDSSGYLMSDSLSVRRTPRQVKKEAVHREEREEEGEGEGVREGRRPKGKERKGEGGGRSAKKTQKRVSRVIPLSLSRRKNTATTTVQSETAEEREEGEEGERRETTKTISNKDSGGEEMSEEATRKKGGGSSRDKERDGGGAAVAKSNQKRGGKVTKEPEREPAGIEPAEETDIIIRTTERKKVKEKKKEETDKKKDKEENKKKTKDGEREGRDGGGGERGGEKVAEDCLLSPGPRSSLSLPSRVKTRHKEAKKRVSISNEVTVMGAGGRGGGEGERGEDGGGEWTPNNRRKLSRVVHSVPAITDNFWEVVAEKMSSGHTAEDCGNEYFRMKGGRRGRRAATHDAGKQKEPAEKVPPPTLTAKVGTIKRKRQVRDILDHLDHGHSDDWFGSIPFKKSKFRNKVVEVELDSSDSEEADEDRLLTTPVGVRPRLGGGGRAPAAGLVDSHTPTLCEYGSTPDYKGGQTQTAADRVIYKQQKARRGPKKPQPPKLSKSVPSSKLPHLKCGGGVSQRDASLHSIHTGELTALRRFEDSDDSCDSNPFSDMEDACQDFIARLH